MFGTKYKHWKKCEKNGDGESNSAGPFCMYAPGDKTEVDDL
jgi:hypothetical protein